MTTGRTWRGTVEPDYFQFYLRRSGASWASDQVSDPGRVDRLWTDGGFVVVGTHRHFGTMPVEVSIVPGPAPAASLDAGWQHVVEVSLEPGGDLEVLNWDPADPVAVVEVDPGPLRLRVAWTNLVAGRFEGLDDDGTTDERVAITAWPAPVAPPEVLRRWDGWPW